MKPVRTMEWSDVGPSVRLLSGLMLSKMFARHDRVSVALAVTTVVALVALLGAPFYLAQSPAARIEEVRKWVPAASATCAFLSVLIAAWVFNRGVVERRRERTIEAWTNYTAFADPLVRRELTTASGELATVDDAEVRDLLLMRRRTLASAVDDVERAQIKRIHRLTDILNALERLAVGCNHRLYDRAFLAVIARQRILSVTLRLEALITASIAMQPAAFKDLQGLRQYLNSLKVK
jgi:hypothetical protein